ESVKYAKLIEWTDELRRHFELTKQAIRLAPILQYPDFSRPFYVATDASVTGIGGVLYQPADNDDAITPTNIVSICSRKSTACQRNYHPYKKELSGLVYCLRQFHSYIWGRLDLVVYTDHKPLTYMFESKEL